MPTPSLRDAIAAELHKPCAERWNSSDAYTHTLHGIDAHYLDADAALKVVGEWLRSEPVARNAISGWECNEFTLDGSCEYSYEDHSLRSLADALTKETLK